MKQDIHNFLMYIELHTNHEQVKSHINKSCHTSIHHVNVPQSIHNIPKTTRAVTNPWIHMVLRLIAYQCVRDQKRHLDMKREIKRDM